LNESPIARRFVERAKRRGYATAPVKTTGMPPGIPYIIGNEAAERFSFYGMRSILVVFMTRYLMDAQGRPGHMSDLQATAWFHNFAFATYFLPIFGGILADTFLGKFRTIIALSLVYCAGHAVLAMNDTRSGLLLGLSLIALGAGGIKPCVSANVGDQFGVSNQHLLPRVFSWFYFSINFGSVFAMLLIPAMLDKWGPHYAFALPGVLMFIATVIFWLGRKKIVHAPPGGVAYLKQTLNSDGLKILGRLAIIYLVVSVFWALFEQSSSTWVLQAQKMDLHWLGWHWLPSQMQSFNPFLVLILIPFFTYVVYPLINKIFPLTPLRKISLGFFVVIPAYLIPAWTEWRLARGEYPSIGWQGLSYLFLTSAEVLISITTLEFAYTQAPKRLKSLVMCFYLASIALGDLWVGQIAGIMEKAHFKLGVDYYLSFAGATLVAAFVFIIVAVMYQPRDFLQDDKPAPA
jgi:POT family proton-dependent oligopeptide transporter